MTENVTQAPAPAEPLLRVLTPGVTDEEVAALVAVFASLSSGPASTKPRATSLWASPASKVRQPLHGVRWTSAARNF